jgi:hypothetical protein
MNMQTQIKICGLSTPATIEAAAKYGATHFGLVHFERSPRHISLEQAAALRKQAPPQLKSVLLLVNADPELTQKALEMVDPDVVQFHGTETPGWRSSSSMHGPKSGRRLGCGTGKRWSMQTGLTIRLTVCFMMHRHKLCPAAQAHGSTGHCSAILSTASPGGWPGG